MTIGDKEALPDERNEAASERRRSGAAMLGTLTLDRQGGRSLHQQLYVAFRDAVLTGRLLPGALVPSTRMLTTELRIARNTAAAVYEQLIAEGLLVATVGSGTRVTRAIPYEFLVLGRTRPRTVSPRDAGARSISARTNSLAGFSSNRADSLPKAFIPGVPAIDQFPAASWTSLATRQWRRASVRDLCSPDPAGSAALRSAISSHVGAARGTFCTASDILVTSGAQQALDLAARVLADPGDTCWIEEPGYPGARHAFSAAGLNLVQAPVDDQGLDVQQAIATLPQPRLIYVTPSHQYPFGGLLSLERRIALLEYADRVGAWIVEDDYDSEFIYHGPSIPCLQGLDAAGRVVYVGSFNKTIFPGLRLGFMIAPADLLGAFRAARTHSDGHPPAVTQTVLAEFMSQGGYVSHLRRMRNIYLQRRNILVRELGENAPTLMLGSRDRGLHFVGYLSDGDDDRAISDLAKQSDIIVPPLSNCYLGKPKRRGLIFGFACVPPNEIAPAVRRLADILNSRRPR